MGVETKKSPKMLTVDAFVDLASYTGFTIDQMLGRDNDHNRTRELPRGLSKLDHDATSELQQIAQSVKGKVVPESGTKQKDLPTKIAPGRNSGQERGR